jgi:aspartate carbamoyltransferase regulatory subunit
MTTTQIKSIKMGTILTWIPTGEKFRVTGFNEFKIKDGTEIKVSGIECDYDGRYSSDSMPAVYTLINCE